MALFIPPIPALDNNGNPIDGAEWRFFLTGTTTPAAVYADSDLATSLGSTVEAQAGGRFPAIYLDSSVTYRARLYDGNGSAVTNGDFDPYNAASTNGAEITPYMFGAVGDGETDDGEALQAFFDFGFNAEPGKNHVFDFSMAMWGTNRTLYALNEYANPLPELGRKFIGGHIRVLPTADLDTYTINQRTTSVAFVMAGAERQNWEGTLYIDGLPYSEATDPPTQSGAPDWEDRLFDVGVILAYANGASIETIRVDGAKRDAVLAIDETMTFRPGTGYEYDHNGAEPNHIAFHIKAITARYCGSYGDSGGYSLAVSTSTKGSTDDAVSPSFSTTTAGFESNNNQRSQIVVTSTAEFAKRDFVKRRYEIFPATFTNVSASAAAGTFTLGSGSTHSFAVGDKITFAGTSLNAGVYEIVELPGAGVIKVWPKPNILETNVTTYTAIYGPWQVLQVQNIRSATTMEVWPWDMTRNNSDLYLCSGFGLSAQGRNLASASVGKIVNSNGGGGGLYAAGLYNIHVGEILAENAEIGVAIGARYGSSTIGLVVDHIHAEAVQFPILAVTQSTHSIINGGSVLDFTGCRVVAALASTSATSADRLTLGKITVDRGGEVIVSSSLYTPYSGASDLHSTDAAAFTNVPGVNNYVHPFNSGTIKIGFDHDVARLAGQHFEGWIHWPGPAGAGGSGSLSLELTAELVHRGWTFGGDASSTTYSLSSGRACSALVTWEQTTKKVIVSTFSSVRILDNTATWNPASIANGASTSTTVTVTGAALGDVAKASFSLALNGLVMTAAVTATDTVTVTLSNLTGGAVDLGSGTVYAAVEKAS